METRATPHSEAAFRFAFDHHYRDVLAYASRRVGSADAEDITAEAFAIAWRKWASAPPEAIRPWLFGIARNVLSNRRRSIRRQERLAAKLASSPAPETETAAVDPDVLSALAALSEREREIVYLHCWEDLAPREIGVVLGCTANAASIRLHRAKRHLEQLLAERTGD